MNLTFEEIKNLEPLTEEDLSRATREELIGLIRGEQSLRASIVEGFIVAITNEMIFKDRAFLAEEKFVRFRTVVFDKRSERMSSLRSGSKKKKKKEREETDSHSKLPSERYPNVDIIERNVECEANPLCPCCGEQMAPAEMYDVSEALSVIPKKFVIVRQKRRKYRCGDCKNGIATTPSPPRITPGSSYSDELIIDVSLSKYCDLVPVERYCKIALRQGVEGLPPNSLIESTHKLADFLLPNYEKIRTETLRSRVLLADETFHRMLEGDEKDRWFLWAFSNEASCFFECHDTRSGDVASAVLAQSQCEVLVSDVYSGYAKAVREANEQRRHQGSTKAIVNAYCNSHARRGFVFDFERGEPGATYMINTYDHLFFIEKQCKGKSRSDILSLRQSMLVRFQEMKIYAEARLAETSEKSALGKAYSYFVKNFHQLIRFIDDPEIPMTNNQSERLLRSPVIGRKTWYGTHSERGAKTSAIHQTLVESCKLIDFNPREYYRESVFRTLQKQPPLSPKEMKALLLQKSSSRPPSIFNPSR
jgi:transposase